MTRHVAARKNTSPELFDLANGRETHVFKKYKRVATMESVQSVRSQECEDEANHMYLLHNPQNNIQTISHSNIDTLCFYLFKVC